MEDHKCQKCGEIVDDIRTLYMACWYDMSELKLPFRTSRVVGEELNQIGEKVFDNSVPLFSSPKEKENFDEIFSKLSVCKSCRAGWMSAIKDWFNSERDLTTKPTIERNVPVRSLGTTIWITEEEWRNT